MLNFENAQEIVDLDLDGKIKLLGAVTQAFLDMQIEFAQISAQHAEARANMVVLKEVKSALQSAIRAEQRL